MAFSLYTPDPLILKAMQESIDRFLIAHLDLPRTTNYVVIGSSGLYIFGILDKFKDIDLLIPDLKTRHAEAQVWVHRRDIWGGRGVRVDGINELEWVGEGMTARVLSTAVMSNGFKVGALDQALDARVFLNRAKDAAVIQRLQEYLASLTPPPPSP